MCITIFVHVDIWGVKVSPSTMTGILLTCTIALSSVIGKVGTRGVGGHQQVKFLITMLYGIGGDPHDCTEWIVDGKHNP
jgi:hypothetical protein|tara:strand:- start:7894 stop:8130 length:237 start_codon:yes stop_codon:yes gene_type:complete